MSEMSALCELYEECAELQMDVMPGEGDLPPMEVSGGGPRDAAPGAGRLEEEGPMEEEAAAAAQPAGGRGPAGRPRAPTPAAAAAARPGLPGLESEDEAEDLDDWEDDYECPEEEPLGGAGCRVSAALEEANKMFLRTSRAREAALDGGFPLHYEKTPFDQLAFIEELFSLMVVNRLTEELGCDEVIDRE
ncbi:EP300-interacting inhibitor of differentiation 1 [Sorex fumeus]|uniref:EP300-interacting inhibitor of differentiation 1 n=1 Tax=Sorex fumeus TaxID=62283 RepID=UPI0024AE2D10|nr:EP300-interacting inhibitor of differentiation 1 [Sorex fumeus]